MSIKRSLLIFSASGIALMALMIVLLVINNPEKLGGTALNNAYVESMINNGQPIAEYSFMGGRCLFYPGEKDEYIALAVFDIDMSDSRVASVSYGQKDVLAETYYKECEAEWLDGLAYSADDRAYVDEWGQLYTTISVPLYSQNVHSLSIDSKDACAWIMSEDQYRTLEEVSSITFLSAENRMTVALE